jgi:hypothetical protein
MKPAAAIVLALLAPGLFGCDTASPPAAPTPAASPGPAPGPAPPPPTLAGERWNLTMQLDSVAGPAECLADTNGVSSGRHLSMGQTGGFFLSVERSAGSIRLATFDFGFYDNAYDRYAGTLLASAFSADAVSNTSITCGGVRYVKNGGTQLSGHFSSDGKKLTASEVYELRSESGASLTYRYEWTASPM